MASFNPQDHGFGFDGRRRGPRRPPSGAGS